MKATKAFLKWAGGKRRQLPRLRELFEPFRDRRYEDWFSGPATVPLGLQPREVLLNDINPHLVNCLQWAQRGFTETLVTLEYSRELYLANRNQFNALILRQDGTWTEDAAQLFYVLNRTGYNGLCRFNRAGEFNPPFGKYKQVNFLDPGKGEFLPWKFAFDGWQIQCGHFRDIDSDDDAFVYADPPFDSVRATPEGTEVIQTSLFGDGAWANKGGGFVGYSTDGFTAEEQLELAERLARRRGPTVLHNRATPRIVRLYQSLGFDLEFVMASRHINCKPGDRRPVKEVIAKKNLGGI